MNTTDSTTVTFTQVYNDFKGALSGMAEALKVGAEHIYEILVRQQMVNAITWSVILVISIYMCLNFVKGATNKKEKWSEDGETLTLLGCARIAQIILFGIALAISMSHIDVIVTGFINPEYGAIMEIKSFIK